MQADLLAMKGWEVGVIAGVVAVIVFFVAYTVRLVRKGAKWTKSAVGELRQERKDVESAEEFQKFAENLQGSATLEKYDRQLKTIYLIQIVARALCWGAGLVLLFAPLFLFELKVDLDPIHETRVVDSFSFFDELILFVESSFRAEKSVMTGTVRISQILLIVFVLFLLIFGGIPLLESLGMYRKLRKRGQTATLLSHLEKNTSYADGIRADLIGKEVFPRVILIAVSLLCGLGYYLLMRNFSYGVETEKVFDFDSMLGGGGILGSEYIQFTYFPLLAYSSKELGIAFYGTVSYALLAVAVGMYLLSLAITIFAANKGRAFLREAESELTSFFDIGLE